MLEADLQFTFAKYLAKQNGVFSVILEYPILCKSLYAEVCDECKSFFKDTIGVLLIYILNIIMMNIV